MIRLDFLSLSDLFSESGMPEIIHECRHCGKCVQSPESACPQCDREGIATYKIR